MALLSQDLKTWLAKLVRLRSWRDLVPPGCTLWTLVIFLVVNIVVLALLRTQRRLPLSIDTPKEADTRKDQEADAKLLELGDIEKQ